MSPGPLTWRSPNNKRLPDRQRKVSNQMKQQAARVQRQGRIYRFTIAGNDYAAFVWQFGAQFRGRVEEHPQVPQCTGRTALAVRDALQQWLTKNAAS
jgi:hypothetical protein